jgi:hypothetical protein
MIFPCKLFSGKNLPKEKCLKDCVLLQAIQDIQSSAEKSDVACGIDYTEENRYALPLSISKNSI